MTISKRKSIGFLTTALSVLCLGAALTGFASSAVAQVGPVKVAAVFSKIYAPGGFDSNDVVQIVGEGMFRNTCYRHAETSVSVDKLKREIHVGPAAYEYGGLCLQMILPFQRVVDVGILPPGKWNIIQEPTSEVLGTVSIAPATVDSADDYLYAPISQAFYKETGTQKEVVLNGEFPNSCFAIESVKVTLEPDVIVLQPIAKMEQRADCQAGSFSFSHTVDIGTVAKGRYLLHVRSMNGNAVNSLVNVE